MTDGHPANEPPDADVPVDGAPHDPSATVNNDTARYADSDTADVSCDSAGESSLLERRELQLRRTVSGSAADQPEGVDSAAIDALQLLNHMFPAKPLSSSQLTTHSTRPDRIGRFEVRGELGRGQFGIVYLAHDSQLKRDVAIKVAGHRVLVDEGLRSRFRREAEVLAKLDHPGLVRIHEADEIDDFPYIVMPVVQGETLQHRLNSQSSPIPIRDALQIVADLAAAMQHGHTQGIIHRDLKPANIIVQDCKPDRHGRRSNVCILDFGLAGWANPDLRETGGGILFGTPMYMAPEQAEGHRDAIGPASDQFALGVILYELLTTQLPFQADGLREWMKLFERCDPARPSSIRAELDAGVDAICLKSLRRDPVERYASMGDFAADLERVLNGQCPFAVQGKRRRLLQESWQRYRGRWLAMSIPLAAVAGLFMTIPQVEKNAASERPQPADAARSFANDAEGLALVAESTMRSPNDSAHQINRCLDFNGIDGFVEVPDLAISAKDSFTMECWMRSRPDDPATGRVWSVFKVPLSINGPLSQWPPANIERPVGGPKIGEFRLDPRNGSIIFNRWNGRSMQGKSHAIPNDHEWVHLAGVYSGKSLSLYVNGVRQDRQIPFHQEAISIGDGILTVGGRLAASGNPALPFNGEIDEIRVSSFHRYNGDFVPVNRLEADEHTLVLFHCDEDLLPGGRLTDSSGNDYRGVLHGGVKLVDRDVIHDLDRRVAEQTIQLGGTVDVATNGDSREVDAVVQLPAEPFEIVWIMLPGVAQVDDAAIEQFVGLPSIEGIDLYATPITDKSAMSIRQMTSLKQVYLHRTAITDAGASKLLDLPRLQGLNLSWTRITNATLRLCAGNQLLRKLKVRGTDISDNGLSTLQGTNFIEFLDIGDTPVTDAGFLPLAGLENISELEIDGTQISARSLEAITDWPLDRLACSIGNITTEDIHEFRQRHPKCYVDVK